MCNKIGYYAEVTLFFGRFFIGILILNNNSHWSKWKNVHFSFTIIPFDLNILAILVACPNFHHHKSYELTTQTDHFLHRFILTTQPNYNDFFTTYCQQANLKK